MFVIKQLFNAIMDSPSLRETEIASMATLKSYSQAHLYDLINVVMNIRLLESQRASLVVQAGFTPEQIRNILVVGPQNDYELAYKEISQAINRILLDNDIR